MKIKILSVNNGVVIAIFKPNLIERYFGKKEGKKKLVRNTDKTLHRDSTLNKEYFYVDEIKLYRRKEKYFNAVRQNERQIIVDKNKCVCDLIREGKVDSGYCGECNMHWG